MHEEKGTEPHRIEVLTVRSWLQGGRDIGYIAACSCGWRHSTLYALSENARAIALNHARAQGEIVANDDIQVEELPEIPAELELTRDHYIRLEAIDNAMRVEYDNDNIIKRAQQIEHYVKTGELKEIDNG